jgi:hypothetical protein
MRLARKKIAPFGLGMRKKQMVKDAHPMGIDFGFFQKKVHQIDNIMLQKLHQNFLVEIRSN